MIMEVLGLLILVAIIGYNNDSTAMTRLKLWYVRKYKLDGQEQQDWAYFLTYFPKSVELLRFPYLYVSWNGSHDDELLINLQEPVWALVKPKMWEHIRSTQKLQRLTVYELLYI